MLDEADTSAPHHLKSGGNRLPTEMPSSARPFGTSLWILQTALEKPANRGCFSDSRPPMRNSATPATTLPST